MATIEHQDRSETCVACAPTQWVNKNTQNGLLDFQKIVCFNKILDNLPDGHQQHLNIVMEATGVVLYAVFKNYILMRN